jgi:hypothetical protein
VAMYLERSEHLPLPGFGSVTVNPLPKATTESDDFKRRVGVRQELQNLQPVLVNHGTAQIASTHVEAGDNGLGTCPSGPENEK